MVVFVTNVHVESLIELTKRLVEEMHVEKV